MAKIETSDLHKTPGGKAGFYRQLQAATQCAREQIAELNGSRTRDMFASGAIHALALLAKEATKHDLPATEKEVDYWRETFFAWFEAVKRHSRHRCGMSFVRKQQPISRYCVRRPALFQKRLGSN